MKINLLEWLDREILVGDGAMGTLLYERGLPIDRPCEELVLTQPDTIRNVHEEYVRAGAQVIETNSFSANPIKLKRHGLENNTFKINLEAARLAELAVHGKEVLVAGSIGPLGITNEEAINQKINRESLFTEQIKGLLEGEVDFLLFETFSDLEELIIALFAAQKLTKGPFACSMSFTEDGVTHRGVTIANAFEELQKAGAHILGANCCVGPRSLAALFSKQGPPPKDIYYSAYPNAGRPEFLDGRYFYPTTPDYFGERGAELSRNGVRLIGGCCGTRPEHIAALKRALLDARGSMLEAKTIPSPRLHAPRSAVTPRASSLERPSLLEIIKQRTLIVTEFDSPKTLLMDKMIEAAHALKQAGTDFLTVADNSLAILRMNCVTAADLVQRETGLPSIVHLACRDRNLIGTQSELMGMDALGLNHVLALTGDPSKVGDSPGATSVYDLNSISLLEGIRAMNSGKTFGGRDLKRPTRFIAGGSFNPNVKNLEVQVKRLERKLAAGAQFVMTQPIFDRSLAKKIFEVTKAFQVPILIGVMPLLNNRNSEFLHNEVPGISIPDDIRERMRNKDGEAGLKEGLSIAREVSGEILQYFKGIYLITPFVRYETTVALSAAIRSGTL